MKKLIIIFCIALLGLKPMVRADEGMWIPLLIDRLNYTDLQKMGLNLTPEEIFSLNNSSLKDAIVIFGGGCTGEIISEEGLLITNHHCGYGSIQRVSTPEANHLQNGFWARNKAEEIPISGLSVRFLKYMEDVTKKVLDGVNDNLSEAERTERINKNRAAVIQEATKDNNYEARVSSFFHGNEFYLFLYERFTDVRLVGTPPESIGKYGADTDNWMWPRHTGDFSMFRVYMSPDGKPAEFSEENIPYKPGHFLPISLQGYKKGDFAMILGFPGSTKRYLTSWGINHEITQHAPMTVKIREKMLSTMKEDMDKDDRIRLQYSSKFARLANYWKYYIGEEKQLKKNKVADKKRVLEAKFTNWAENNRTYAQSLPMVKEAYKEIAEYYPANLYYREAISRGVEIISYAGRYAALYRELEKKNPDEEKIASLTKNLKSGLDRYFKDYNAPLDQKLLAVGASFYYEDIIADQQPEYLRKLGKKYKGDFSKFSAALFNKSMFASKDRLEDFLNNPSAKKLAKDPAFKFNRAFSAHNAMIQSKLAQPYEKRDKGMRLFTAGLQKMMPDKAFYPDANSSMRLTYGSVQDYDPADAVHYNYYTTIDGVMQKEDPLVREFNVPKKLKKLYKAKDYGRYAEDGTIHTCFLTTNDITGGNSGSGVINGDGQLIGLAFDGNWESMSGDINFEKEIQRCINVDIRYVVFLIDKLAGAQNIIDEMTLIYKQPRFKVGLPEKAKVSEK